MGSVYRLPFFYIEEMSLLFQKFKENGVVSYAAHLKGEKSYDRFDYRGKSAFVIGNEGNGLTEETAAFASNYLKIPMEGQVESLNAAMACGILMYEAHRQRNL
jgi:TrmH family RNA methyltransferase